MSVTVKIKGNTITACIKGEIDHHTAPDMRSAIDDAVTSCDTAKKVVLDFSGVSFMDSSGVGLVMGRCRTAALTGKSVKVINLSERDYRIMKMSGIEKIAPLAKRGQGVNS